jgi:hypothetical protein
MIAKPSFDSGSLDQARPGPLIEAAAPNADAVDDPDPEEVGDHNDGPPLYLESNAPDTPAKQRSRLSFPDAPVVHIANATEVEHPTRPPTPCGPPDVLGRAKGLTLALVHFFDPAGFPDDPDR